MSELTHKNERAGKSSGHIVLFGTGDFAQALGWRLYKVGYKITFVSRDPVATRKKIMDDYCDIVTAKDAKALSKDIIILAIPETVKTKELDPLFANQVVLDVRNKTRLKRSTRDYSLAQDLQNIHPDANVVKSLNNLSAYALRSGIYQSGSQTALCGDDSAAKDKVSKVLRKLGLTPVDVGDIGQAVELENRPHAFFGEWKTAVIITAVNLSFFWTILFFRYAICPNLENEEWDWSLFEPVILLIAQLSFGITALMDLTFCYTPGVIAAYIQLYRGTKYSLFPNWLDTWLKSRKQLGLIAVQMALTHWIGAMAYVLGKPNEYVQWRSDSYFITGIFGFCLMAILAYVSFPSVASTLSWMEFSFMQRYLGWWSMIFSTLHIIFLAWDHLIQNRFMCVFIPGQLQIVVMFPLLTILFKLPLLFPPIDNKLKKIRQGVDSKQGKRVTTANYNIEEGTANVGFASE